MFVSCRISDQVLQLLVEMQHDIKDLQQQQQRLAVMVSQQSAHDDQSDLHLPVGLQLPLSSDDDIDAMETALADDKFRSSLVIVIFRSFFVVMLHNNTYVLFLQRVSMACYVERCISYDRFRPSVCPSVRHCVVSCQNN